MIKDQHLLNGWSIAGITMARPRVCVPELEKGRNIVLEIDVEGSMKIRDMFKFHPSFIVPPSYEELKDASRENRGRGDHTKKA